MVRPRHFRFPLAAAALLALAGCPPQDRPLTGSGMDMFAPVKMRIHPLTRAVASPAQIEARIEFTDQMGDVTKGVGTLQFALYRYDFGRGQRVGAWPIDLAAPEANKKNWDAITRTYLCRLMLDDPGFVQPGRKYLLTATMTFPNNTHLDEEFQITIPK